MSKFEIIIKETEDKWLTELYNHVKSTFAAEPLPSHNENHHLRVWNYSKNLLSGLINRGVIIDKTFLEELIITTFFHDIGMSITRDSSHGKEGRRLCEEWLVKNPVSKNLNTEAVLNAIETHDDKSYLFPGGLTLGSQPRLLPILNVCDDLDAFSYCGIYRYSEIYLLRGVAIGELGQQVIANASTRFGNFMSGCIHIPEMIKMHAPRYDTLENFFRQYNAQLRKDPTGRSIDHGPVNIVKSFYRQILAGENSIENLCTSTADEQTGIYEKNFFENLRKEWCNPGIAIPDKPTSP